MEMDEEKIEILTTWFTELHLANSKHVCVVGMLSTAMHGVCVDEDAPPAQHFGSFILVSDSTVVSEISTEAKGKAPA